MASERTSRNVNHRQTSSFTVNLVTENIKIRLGFKLKQYACTPCDQNVLFASLCIVRLNVQNSYQMCCLQHTGKKARVTVRI